MGPHDLTPAAIAAFRSGDMAATIRLARQALAGGDDAVLHHLLGVALCRSGDLSLGIDHLRRAATLRPRDPQILVMLMRALIDAQRPSEALALPFSAEGLAAPAIAALWRTRAEAAHAARDEAEEAAALRRVVELDPADDGARDLLVPLLLATEEPAAALAQLDALAPSRLRARHRVAALVALRRFDEAAALDAQLLASDAQDRAAWLSAVLVAERRRDRDRLEALVAHAGANGYPPAEIDYARALIAKEDGQVEAALALAQASEVPAEPARPFALAATLADRLGRADAAVAAARARAAATPRLDHWRERGAAHRSALDHLFTRMTTEWAAGWSPPPPLDRPPPAFLVGFPRSGTTLLDTFLMGHPEVRVLEEENMLERASQVLGPQQDLDRVDPATVARARAVYFETLDRHLSAGDEARLVIDKLPLAMTGVAAIKRLFPSAKIIFAMRHPADCLVSNLLQAFRLNDAMANFLDRDDAGRFYDVAMRVWTRAVDLLEVDTRTVAYEDLVADPAGALRPLIEWLGLPWDLALLDHRATAAARGAIVTPSFDQVTQPLHRRAVGRWRGYADFLDPVRPLIEPWAIRHGYGPMD